MPFKHWQLSIQKCCMIKQVICEGTLKPGAYVRHCSHLFASALGLTQFSALVPASMRHLLLSLERSKTKFSGLGAEEAEMRGLTQTQLCFMKKKWKPLRTTSGCFHNRLRPSIQAEMPWRLISFQHPYHAHIKGNTTLHVTTCTVCVAVPTRWACPRVCSLPGYRRPMSSPSKAAQIILLGASQN